MVYHCTHSVTVWPVLLSRDSVVTRETARRLMQRGRRGATKNVVLRLLGGSRVQCKSKEERAKAVFPCGCRFCPLSAFTVTNVSIEKASKQKTTTTTNTNPTHSHAETTTSFFTLYHYRCVKKKGEGESALAF